MPAFFSTSSNTGNGKSGGASACVRLVASAAHSMRLTLVIYMGVSNAAHLQSELLCGLPGSTPVAVIQDASLPSQRHAVATLDALCTTIERERLTSPCIIVVGDVLSGLAQLQLPAVLCA